MTNARVGPPGAVPAGGNLSYERRSTQPRYPESVDNDRQMTGSIRVDKCFQERVGELQGILQAWGVGSVLKETVKRVNA